MAWRRVVQLLQKSAERVSDALEFVVFAEGASGLSQEPPPSQRIFACVLFCLRTEGASLPSAALLRVT